MNILSRLKKTDRDRLWTLSCLPFFCTVKVLILHQHFKTPQNGGAIRSYYLAKALVDRGIQTIVITAHNEQQERTEFVDGIEVHYLPIAYDNRFGFYKRSYSFLKYIVHSVTTARNFKDVDVCYAISVPLTIGLAAMWIKKRYKIPYIFEVGDLWPDAPIQMGFVKNYFFREALYGLERAVYRQAKSIVALSSMIREAVEKKVPGKTVHTIPNMADTDFYKPGKLDALVNRYGVQNKFVVSYIGALGVANGLEYYLECARASQQAGLPVHFLLCGDGAVLDSLKRISAQWELMNFTILPFQDRDGVKEIMLVTDAAFVCYKDVPILETGSPNKYFDGLAAGKMIIVNARGWMREEVEKNHCGIFVDPQSPRDFVTKITPYLQDKSLLKDSSLRARALAEEKYSRELLGEKFARIFLEG